MRALWAELRRRHVVRMAVAYCALAWLVLQVAALLVPIFDIPNWALKLLVLVVVLGFPFALLFSWHYAWADGGLVRESATAGEPRGSAATAGFDAVQAIAPAPAEASIAVLPLVNMSSDREQDYFSDGLSEELLNLLAQVPGLHVAGRTSSFSFKDKPATIGEIGRALNVATVLEGSVRKSGERVRITAQLVKARDGYHLWSQAYDRELTDIFAVQDEIAAAVVDALKLRLLPAQQPSTAGHHVPGTAAYKNFLLGRQLLNRATEEGFHRAVGEFAQAVALEPGYAAALAGLALAEAYASDYTDSDAAMLAGRERAGDAAERAVASDPLLGEAYTARAVLRFVFDLDWNGGDADFAQALVFNPGDVMTHWQYSRLLAALGRLPEALASASQATQLDPLSAQAWETRARYEPATSRQRAGRWNRHWTSRPTMAARPSAWAWRHCSKAIPPRRAPGMRAATTKPSGSRAWRWPRTILATMRNPGASCRNCWPATRTTARTRSPACLPGGTNTTPHSTGCNARCRNAMPGCNT